jgi:predicted metal-binding membrane protein
VASSTLSAEPPRARTPQRHRSRDNLIVVGALVAAAVLAWAWLFLLPMGEMPAEPLSASYLLPAFSMWSIMMVAMMVPSAIPMHLLHARIDKTPSARRRAMHSYLFALAYLLIWAAFSAAAPLAQALLIRAGLVSAMTLSLGSGALAAAILVLVAAYEMTAAKRVCLDKCQSPLLFVLKNLRPGASGAFRLGLLHGLFCLGCCWALMLLLFVGGVMNLAWVAVIGIIVIGEKVAPPRWHLERYVAAALLLGGLALLAG